MKKVLVLFGGPSNEHLVSCRSAKSIIDNIDDKKYDVSICGISKDGEWYLFDGDLDKLESGNWLVTDEEKKINNIVEYLKNFDVVFPIIHGVLGEDGSLAGLFLMLGIKYVGSSALAHAIGFDKYYTKLICNNIDINQVDYIVIKQGENKYLKKVEEQFNYPVIVKPCCSGSSIGINVAYNKKEVSQFLKEAFKYDDKVIVERYIANRREFECGILFDKKVIVSSVGEIVIDDGIYDFDSKYVKKSDTIVPAFIPRELEEKIKKWSIDIFNIIGCKGLARVDFIYDVDNDKLYFNEINTMPGFTDISMYSKVFINDGISYKSLISKLIDNA